MKCKNLEEENLCSKLAISCDFFGIKNADFLPRCPYDGDVQKCLDNLAQKIQSKELKSRRKLTSKDIMVMFGVIE